ncbi:hypothetical protein A0H81_13223 [Grifola frondosa]|uniref:Uncharacterized protein n=1 Tax=Grifola frondosa TaxID=5627 RepID=A0A1C7LPN1_GRIFR|nr:hypothetical protein A0H81_13223 [Grifola frondosa]
MVSRRLLMNWQPLHTPSVNVSARSNNVWNSLRAVVLSNTEFAQPLPAPRMSLCENITESHRAICQDAGAELLAVVDVRSPFCHRHPAALLAVDFPFLDAVLAATFYADHTLTLGLELPPYLCTPRLLEVVRCYMCELRPPLMAVLRTACSPRARRPPAVSLDMIALDNEGKYPVPHGERHWSPWRCPPRSPQRQARVLPGLADPLGSVQEQQLGTFLRDTYLDAASPSFINGISADLADINQLIVRADAGGDGSVILDSVQGLLQGLFPPTMDNNITLANGMTIVGPLGGYQYIPVESVQPNLDILLTSFTSCPNFDQHILDFYASAPFLAEAQVAAPFITQLQPFLNNHSIDFTNMFNIFDFVNVQMVHNATFLSLIPPSFPPQSYDFANFHEHGVFTDSPNGISNVVIQTILPSIFTSLTRITNTSDTLKITLNEISYKPFISLFNLTLATTDPDLHLRGIVDYTSVVALKLSATDGELA